jgi:hypothetical protein
LVADEIGESLTPVTIRDISLFRLDVKAQGASWPEIADFSAEEMDKLVAAAKLVESNESDDGAERGLDASWVKKEVDTAKSEAA